MQNIKDGLLRVNRPNERESDRMSYRFAKILPVLADTCTPVLSAASLLSVSASMCCDTTGFQDTVGCDRSTTPNGQATSCRSSQVATSVCVCACVSVCACACWACHTLVALLLLQHFLSPCCHCLAVPRNVFCLSLLAPIFLSHSPSLSISERNYVSSSSQCGHYRYYPSVLASSAPYKKITTSPVQPHHGSAGTCMLPPNTTLPCLFFKQHPCTPDIFVCMTLYNLYFFSSHVARKMPGL